LSHDIKPSHLNKLIGQPSASQWIVTDHDHSHAQHLREALASGQRMQLEIN
jgi:hypothetical protein